MPPSNPYESERLLAEYLLFHYGEPEEVLPWAGGPRDALDFAVRSVARLLPEDGRSYRRALDLGCAVGRSSFELARHADAVLGIDFSASFIAAALRLRDEGSVPFRRHDEGRRFTGLTARRPGTADPARVSFEVGDAQDLRADVGTFDLVHAANLICRLPQPGRLFDRLPRLVQPDGILLLTTPCTWLGEFTPPENWPEGATLDWIAASLAPHFTLEFTLDLPFLIRETARKYQWTVAQGSRWRRSDA